MVGDAVPTPCMVNIKDDCPTPKSYDIDFYSEWRNDWKDVVLSEIVNNINKENV
ncbi:hypothetical protein ACQ4XT_01930 [Halobacillus faecis]